MPTATRSPTSISNPGIHALVARPPFEEIALGSDAAAIVHVLSDAIRRSGPYEGVANESIAGIKGCDVRVARSS
jgi:hypothetical protein